MAHFILVHGAWHGGWCWEKVVPLLESAGHRVDAPDLAGTGEDKTELEDDVLRQWSMQIGALTDRNDPAILVGHSRGGIVISETAERFFESVSQSIYVTAILLPPGVSIQDEMASFGADKGPELVIDAEHGTCTIRKGTEFDVLYGRCEKPVADQAIARLCPEPIEAISRRLRLTERYAQVPRSYIEARHDQAILLDHQRKMHARQPCEKVLTLDSDHSPFYSATTELADALCQLAR